MEKTSDGFRLSSGREFYANRHLVSISRDDDSGAGEWLIGEGYDGTVLIDAKSSPNADWSEPGSEWTLPERAELADYMIALWQEFKAGK